jgi:hypothetical protein
MIARLLRMPMHRLGDPEPGAVAGIDRRCVFLRTLTGDIVPATLHVAVAVDAVAVDAVAVDAVAVDAVAVDAVAVDAAVAEMPADATLGSAAAEMPTDATLGSAVAASSAVVASSAVAAASAVAGAAPHVFTVTVEPTRDVEVTLIVRDCGSGRRLQVVHAAAAPFAALFGRVPAGLNPACSTATAAESPQAEPLPLPRPQHHQHGLAEFLPNLGTLEALTAAARDAATVGAGLVSIRTVARHTDDARKTFRVDVLVDPSMLGTGTGTTGTDGGTGTGGGPGGGTDGNPGTGTTGIDIPLIVSLAVPSVDLLAPLKRGADGPAERSVGGRELEGVRIHTIVNDDGNSNSINDNNNNNNNLHPDCKGTDSNSIIDDAAAGIASMDVGHTERTWVLVERVGKGAFAEVWSARPTADNDDGCGAQAAPDAPTSDEGGSGKPGAAVKVISKHWGFDLDDDDGSSGKGTEDEAQVLGRTYVPN